MTLTEEQPPTTPPPISPSTSLVTSRSYIALLVVDTPATDLRPEVDAVVNMAIKLQQDQRPVEVFVLVDAAIASQAHDDFARRKPEDAGLRPWRLLTYSNSLDLLQVVAKELLRAIAEPSEIASPEKGGMEL